MVSWLHQQIATGLVLTTKNLLAEVGGRACRRGGLYEKTHRFTADTFSVPTVCLTTLTGDRSFGLKILYVRLFFEGMNPIEKELKEEDTDFYKQDLSE